ncbi:MAG TPA: N-formylglutamate amidohydrolase [Rhizomicrobium sp.]|jgi:N-formylglutamate deformylase|nr:N-formylglutamate amidohydrolase [Rhizomicrobium sp.]
MSHTPTDPFDAAADNVLLRLFAHPYRLTWPQCWSVPFLFASPHSGRCYPESLLKRSRLDPVTLRRSEDAYVDELFGGANGLGAPLLAAEFPRAFLDVNRGIAELDAGMFDGRLAVPVDMPGPRVSAGLGVIPRIVRDGAEIYRGKLEPLEAAERLTRLYQPYHKALSQLIAQARARFGAAVLIDCHSMPSALGAPDIVLGDRYGASAAPALSAAAEEVFIASGFGVARNTPYAGGHTTVEYGRGSAGVHVLQIEINRALYLDEENVARKAGFDMVKARLTAALAQLTRISPALLRPSSLPEAAE